jgi:glyoxylase-like metal-dependent hydrolase (beta-lactamase superfamily II)
MFLWWKVSVIYLKYAGLKMKIKDKRSVFLLFVAMLISSVVIGSVCQISFDPVPNLNSTAEAPTTIQTQSSYAPVDVEMSLKQVAEHTWYVQGKAGMATDNAGFISNAGVVITDKGVVVFDALGTPSLAYKLVQTIREITDQPIVKVIVSHYHADHILGLQVFKELGAEIIAPDGVYEYIDSEAASSRLQERRMSLQPWVNDKTLLVKPDRIIDKGETFSVGNIKFTLNVIGPAHSDGDMTLYIENDKVLFTGDLIFEGRLPFLGNKNTQRWLQTLQRMETAQLKALVPGHGPAAKAPNKAIALTRKYLAFIREKMAAAVEDLTEFDEAYSAIDWSEFESLPAFEAANRKNAFMVYLAMEAEGE